MTIQHLTPSNYITTKWSGGLTTQLGIAPASAVYADRDFLWRLSSESVELKADEAARLDGYAGEIKLCSKTGAKLMLAKAKAV